MEIRNLDPDIDRTIQRVYARADQCQIAFGGHFEQPCNQFFRFTFFGLLNYFKFEIFIFLQK